jgi:hypothetical protein
MKVEIQLCTHCYGKVVLFFSELQLAQEGQVFLTC